VRACRLFARNRKQSAYRLRCPWICRAALSGYSSNSPGSRALTPSLPRPDRPPMPARGRRSAPIASSGRGVKPIEASTDLKPPRIDWLRRRATKVAAFSECNSFTSICSRCRDFASPAFTQGVLAPPYIGGPYRESGGAPHLMLLGQLVGQRRYRRALWKAAVERRIENRWPSARRRPQRPRAGCFDANRAAGFVQSKLA